MLTSPVRLTRSYSPRGKGGSGIVRVLTYPVEVPGSLLSPLLPTISDSGLVNRSQQTQIMCSLASVSKDSSQPEGFVLDARDQGA